MDKFDLSTKEKRKELYDLFSSFNLRKEIYAHFGICRNTANSQYIKNVCEQIGFDLSSYDVKKKKYEKRYCLNCGKEIVTGDYRKKFCDSSCASTYNNKHREHKKIDKISTEEKILNKIDNGIIIEKRFTNGNHKKVGERGERIAIGELAKYNIDVLFPMSDNLPFDLVVYYNNKFFKCQVKTTNSVTTNDSLSFKLKTNNWYSKTEHKYTKNEVDIFILCDLTNVYLLKIDEAKGKGNFIIRNSSPKSKQYEGIHFASDYIISEKRIEEVFR